MSAKDEFEEMDALLNNEPPAPRKPPVKKVTAPKPGDAVQPGERVAEDPAETLPASNSFVINEAPAAPGVSLADFQALMAEVKSLRSALAEKETAPVGMAEMLLPASPVAEATEVDQPKGTLIHFTEDGFTVGNRVFYRGEQYFVPEGQTWWQMSGRDQTAKFGRRYFRVGPWDGESFDLTDPNLDKSDRARLLEIARRQQELARQYR